MKNINNKSSVSSEIDNPSLCASDLLWDIESLCSDNKRIYGWGWLFNRQYPIKELLFRVKIKGQYYSSSCQYGITRKDIVNQHNYSFALNSGFIISCCRPIGDIEECQLQIKYTDGNLHKIEISRLMAINNRLSKKHPLLMRQWIWKALNILARGNFRQLITKSKNKMQYIWHYRNSPQSDVSRIIKKISNFKEADISVIIDHNMGGGANLYREEWLRTHKSEDNIIIFLYYDLPSLSYVLRIYKKQSQQEIVLASLDIFFDVVVQLRPQEIILNNIVSFDDPLKLISFLPGLRNTIATKIIVPIHDYYLICPSYQLIDNSGKFCGIPQINHCQTCLPHNHGDFSDFANYVDINLWRHTWEICLDNADIILCFSQSSKNLLHRAYPELDSTKIEIQPHSVNYLKGNSVRLDYNKELNIGVVGQISKNKGADIVREIAYLIQKRKLPIKITIIGELEGGSESSTIKVLGSYKREKLTELIEKSGANLFFFPSIWPETFSYVTEELIRSEVPIAVFNLGAPAERIANYSKGLIIKEINPEIALNELIGFYKKIQNNNNG